MDKNIYVRYGKKLNKEHKMALRLVGSALKSGSTSETLSPTSSPNPQREKFPQIKTKTPSLPTSTFNINHPLSLESNHPSCQIIDGSYFLTRVSSHLLDTCRLIFLETYFNRIRTIKRCLK